MKSAIAIAAIAGLASVAAADSLSVDVSFADASIAVGETTTATVMANFTVDGTIGGYLGVVSFGLAGDDSLATSSNLVSGDWHNSGAQSGSTSGSGVSDFKMGQAGLFGPTDNSNPIMIMTFTVTADAEGVLSYAGVDGAPYSFGVLDLADGNFGVPTQYDASVVSSGRLTITPAPSAMALLGLGGLVAGRRRR